MSLKKTKSTASLLAGVVGGGIFLLFLFLLKLNIFLSIGIAAAAYAGLYFVFSPDKDKDIELQMHGVTREMLDQVLKEGTQRIRELRGFVPRIKKAEVKARLEGICVLIEKIYEDFQVDPKDVKVARQFLNYYFEATIKIINRYTELQKQAGVSSDVKKSLDKVEKLLGDIEKTFEKQLARLLEDDVLDLDSEIQLMENTMRMDGIDTDDTGSATG